MIASVRNGLLRVALGAAVGAMAAVIWVPYLVYNRDCPPLAVLACAALGGMAGIATLPFADSGRALVLHSAGHFVLTAVFFALLVWQLGAKSWDTVLSWEGLLALLYALIWLGRWIGWYMEVSRLRVLLGLEPGPTPLKWRETLPYLPFVLLLCVGAPLALRGMERLLGADVPVLTGMMYPMIILPVASLCAGVSLGKRRGLCPLFPLACFVCYLPTVFLLYNRTALFHCFMTAVPALLGVLAGWGLMWRGKEKTK